MTWKVTTGTYPNNHLIGSDEQLLVYREVPTASTGFDLLNAFLEGNSEALSLLSENQGVGVGQKKA